MKRLLVEILSLAAIVFITIVLYTAFDSRHRIGKDEVAVPKHTWDSICAMANQQPIIQIDTFYVYRDTGTHTIITRPVITEKEGKKSYSEDSLITPDVWVKVLDSYTGSVKNWDRQWLWKLKPVRTQVITKTISTPVPKPVPYEVVKEMKGAIMIEAGIGGGRYVAPSIELSYLTGRGQVIGAEVMRYGDHNIYSLKGGFFLKW